MSFLAPWALAAGVLAAASVVLLHLVARHRPTAWLLPTARFIPDRQTLVSRAAARPRDLLVLALRVLLLLSAGTAFARPVFTGTHGARARVVLVDQSSVVADPAAARRRALALSTAEIPAVMVAFEGGRSGDGAGTEAGRSGDGAGTERGRTLAAGSLTAGLIAARRAAQSLAPDADSVELVVVSPLAASEIDAATWAVRALWPGAIRVERVALRSDTAAAPSLERAVPASDVLGPALVGLPVRATAGAVRLRRSARANAADSAFARHGGTVVLWDSASTTFAASGIALGDDVIVAPLGRLPLDTAGRAAAWWADGTAAARDVKVSTGCLRTVGIGVPAAGDLALRGGFQRIVRGLVTPCAAEVRATLADSDAVTRLAGVGGSPSGASLASTERAPSRIVPWLLGIAIACALLEPLVRRRVPRLDVA